MSNSFQSDQIESIATIFLKDDKLISTVVRGHLLIEGFLDEIIETIAFNPKYIEKANFSFSNKILIAKAFCKNKDKNEVWETIDKINKLRNVLAHSIDEQKIDTKVSEFCEFYKNKTSNEMQIYCTDNDATFRTACIECLGFLHAFKRDIAALRKMIDIL